MLSPLPLGFCATQLMSKELNGPPGVPVLLCSGTGMTSMTAYWPPVVVPHVGQPATPPQPLKITNSAARITVNRILVLIESPPAISLPRRLRTVPASTELFECSLAPLLTVLTATDRQAHRF